MARSRHRDDDDDDDDYDDRPRKKRRPRDDDDDDDDRGSGGSKTGLIIAGAVIGGVLLIGTVIVAVVFSGTKEKKNDEPPIANNTNPNPNPNVGPQIPGIGPGMFAPKNNTPPPQKKDEPPKLAPGTVPLPTPNLSLLQVVFGGGSTGYAAVVSFSQMGIGNTIDVVHLPTGKFAGQVKSDEPHADQFAVSPDGKYLSELDSSPFEGHTVSLYTVADGKLGKKFRPYPKKDNITTPDLIWASFVAADKLLTLHEGGGFDVWTVPSFERVAGATNTLPVGTRNVTNGFTHSPASFALTSDGATLAIFNGSGIAFYATATASEIAKTEPIMMKSDSCSFSGAAFSPDGKQFTAYYQVFSGTGGGIALRTFDAKTGANVRSTTVGKSVGAPAGMCYWGPNHLAFQQGGIGSVRVIDLATGQDVGKVETSIPGKFGPVPPTGDLWAITGGGSVEQKPNTSYLVRAAPPASLESGSTWELNIRGLEQKVKGRR